MASTAPIAVATLTERREDAGAAEEDTPIAAFTFDTNFNRWSCFSFVLKRDGGLECRYVPVPWIPQSPLDVSSCRTAVSQDGVVELAIPLALFNCEGRVDEPMALPPAEGSVWGANFVMIDPSGRTEMSWARVRRGTDHRPDAFNAIRFDGPNERR